ncbi:MAG: amino acid ABC transporter substrate-binding protein [Deltaproteobacteria bacterium]|nr:amino acid ABC transporter substrate-binding protein [Deltaproteobacteria bacterium]
MTRSLQRSAVALALTFALGCAGAMRGVAPGPAVPSAPPLSAGLPNSSPPFSSEQDGELVGLEPELARELARELGRDIELHSYDFEDLIPALRGGDVDVVMAGLTTTPLRALRIRFTEPYLTTGQRLLVRSDDVTSLATPEAVRGAGARVGVLRASTGEQYARAKLAPAPVWAYAELTDALADLADGDLDVVVCDAPIAGAFAASRASGDLVAVGGLLTHEDLAWGVRREDEALRDALDAALARLRASGRLDELVHRWAPPPR